ncbi:transposon Tf2-8 polyprotein [Trichonephila clavipes]|nr:transposon Tf2-8 polyprotein [Trichonephila clavipes]
MIKSIKTLSLPVPTRSENFNLFFQLLERAFLTKKINDEYKSEILINLLGERAHNVLLYIEKEELNDYEKLKSIVLREFQVTPRECLNSFKNAAKSSGETYIQFAARLMANFQYYCSLRKVNSLESLCDLLISDKLFETLNKETTTHIGIREAEDWFRPIDLAKECDIYISSRSGSPKPLSDLLRDNAVFHFGPEQQLAFQTLRQKLSENPVLHIFKQGAKLELHTDASKFGYGAILLQQSDDNKLHPVHYFSKKTTSQEEKYSSYELEVLAVIESLKKFRNYLVGNKFKIVTDCSAFQKTMSKKQLNPKIARWALFLEDFNYEIIRRPGKQMGHVDCLSRYPVMKHNI